MKIAIITWFSNLNFGTALQAFALQKYLKDKFGANVSLINYLPNESNQLNNFEKKTEHIGYKLYDHFKRAIYDDSKVFNARFENEFKKYKKLKEEKFKDYLSQIKFTNDPLDKISDEFDYFICGSDQILNPQILDKNYYLDFVKDKPKISYAASFGINYLPNYSKEYIKKYFNNFKGIGLREETCIKSLEILLGRNDIVHTLDPTFLLGKEFWSSVANFETPKEEYSLSYFLGTSKANNNVLDYLSNNKIKNIDLPSTNLALEKCENKEYLTYGPVEFISLIKNAEYVVADSFHALCFSIIFEKDFCILNKHKNSNPFNQNSRINSLLKASGLENRLANNLNDVKNIINSPIDYEKVNDKLNKYIENSKKFLDDNLND